MSHFKSEWTTWGTKTSKGESAKSDISPLAPSSGTSGTDLTGGFLQIYSPNDPSTAAQTFRRMESAIQSINEVYPDNFMMQLNAEGQRKLNELNQMKISTPADAIKWENHWIDLIDQTQK